MESTGREPEELDAAQEVDAEEELGVEQDAAGEQGIDGGTADADLDGADLDGAEADGGSHDGDESDQPAGSDEPSEEVLVAARPRTAPRYGAFIGAGVVAGILLALILFFVLPTDGSSSSLTGLIYLAILVTPLTALLGGLAAVLFERRTLRK